MRGPSCDIEIDQLCSGRDQEQQNNNKKKQRKNYMCTEIRDF
jgi:predicted nucleic acid-binding Zn ribbon protein